MAEAKSLEVLLQYAKKKDKKLEGSTPIYRTKKLISLE